MTQRSSQLQEELGQPSPFACAQQEAVVGLLRTASILQRQFSSVVEPFGVTFQQYNVLRILRGAPDPLPTMEISNRMIEQTPGITRLLDRLGEKGLISRERCAEDRRQVLCSISEKGKSLVDALDDPMLAMDHEALAMLDPAGVKQLIALLDAIRNG